MALFWARSITYEIKPGIFEEKRGNAALLFKNFGFYFIFAPNYALFVGDLKVRDLKTVV